MTIRRFQVGEQLAGFPGDTINEISNRLELMEARLAAAEILNGVPMDAGIHLLCASSTTITQRGIVSVGSIYRDPNETENDLAGNPKEINAGYLQQSPVFAASAPVAADKSPGVAWEPIEANGSPGWVMVSGVAWALVDITDTDHDYCQVIDGDTTKFASAESGIKIKWKPTGTGEKICAVLLCLNTDFAEPPEAPLGDPPVAFAIQDTSVGGDITLEPGTIPAAGLTVTEYQWVFSLSGDSLVIAGLVGSVPNYVYDSRLTLSLSDVGTNITGTHGITIDETAGGLTGPYSVKYVPVQSDTQQKQTDVYYGLEFDGLTGDVDCGSDASIDSFWSGGATVVMMVKPDGDGENNLGTLFDKRGAATGTLLRLAAEAGGSSKIQFIQDWSTTVEDSITTAVELPNSVWSQVAVSYDSDSTSNRPTISVNAIAVAVTNTTTAAGTLQGGDAENLLVGNRPADDRTFDGIIGDFRIYDKELTESELANLSSVSANLIMRIPFSEGTGSTAADSVGSNDGTITGATWS